MARISNAALAQDIAVLKTEVSAGHDALRQQFDAGYSLIIEKLKPLEEFKKQLEKTQTELDTQGKEFREQIAAQGRSISWMRGVGATLALLFTGFIAYFKAAHK